MSTRPRQLVGHGLAAAAGLGLLIATGCERPAATAAPPPPERQPPTGAAPPVAKQDAKPDSASKRPAPPAGLVEQAKKPRVLSKTFDDIKFDIEPDAPFDRGMLTDPIERLNGQRIEIRGYILPGAQRKLHDFVLVRDNQECCFGPGAALYDCILVSMAPGKIADFSIRPVAVSGEFHIEPFELGGVTRAVFRMTADVVTR